MNVTRLLRNKVISTSRSFLIGRTFQTTSFNMVQEGDKIPSVEMYEDTPATKVNLADLARNKKLVVFAVPGAFTPGCSQTHLPGYIKNSDELKKNGVDEIICISVNDPFVMAAWGKAHHVEKKIRMLADPAAAFTKAMKLDTDIPPLGGIRSKRYSMLVENGQIKSLNVEPDGTGLSCSLAEHMKVK